MHVIMTHTNYFTKVTFNNLPHLLILFVLYKWKKMHPYKNIIPLIKKRPIKMLAWTMVFPKLATFSSISLNSWMTEVNSWLYPRQKSKAKAFPVRWTPREADDENIFISFLLKNIFLTQRNYSCSHKHFHNNNLFHQTFESVFFKNEKIIPHAGEPK